MVDLHRHDEGSLFDGFGKPGELAKVAKSLGYTSLGISNHGNMVTAVKHYNACRQNGIKPIIGVEGYFLPKLREKHRGYHLCLFAKNKNGYKNLNLIQTEGEKQKYYNGIWTLDLLKEFHEDVICTTACVSSYFGAAIKDGKISQAEKLLLELQDIFKDDLYVEIQPYKISEVGLQETVNHVMMNLASKHDVRCILTSDSHMGSKNDLDTYLKLHEIANHELGEIEATYVERYMPTEDELIQRFVKMHSGNLSPNVAIYRAKTMVENLQEIENKIDGDMFETLSRTIPIYKPKINSDELLKAKIKQGLLERNVNDEAYKERAQYEFNTIKDSGFSDYFLIVQEYIKWAKDQGIVVGPGRGSCCNFLTGYLLGITDVDSLRFDLEPDRFLARGRNKIPDIDLDFDSTRRDEVINHVLDTYPGKSAKVCSYGLYKIDNTINDLAKVCGLLSFGTMEETERKRNKEKIAEIKRHIRSFEVDTGVDIEIDFDELKNHPTTKRYNENYDNIIKHFIKLYNKIKYIGTHAAGVVINDDLLQYTSVKYDKDGNPCVAYDLKDIESLGVVKFDILALSTLSEISICREQTGRESDLNDILVDRETLDAFKMGKCDGVFQFDKRSVQSILREVEAHTVDDIIAVNAMNRPGPLSNGTHKLYAENKQNQIPGAFDKWLKKTYGTILYQEQVMRMAIDIAGVTTDEALKFIKLSSGSKKDTDFFEKDYPVFKKKFLDGCKKLKLKISRSEAESVFQSFFSYSFNQGHATGYSLMSIEQMYYKIHCPAVFWYAKLKHTKEEDKLWKYLMGCITDCGIVFLPHVNYTAEYSLRDFDGERVMQQGLTTIKNIGLKAAQKIENERNENGAFKDYDDFIKRCKSRSVTSRVVAALKEAGALEFDENKYLQRTKAYSSALIQKSLNRR